MNEKTCTRCGASKPLESFHRRRASKDGRQSMCKDCMNVFSAGYYAKNHDVVRFKRRVRYVDQAISQ